VIAVAMIATMLGDQVYFQAARARGRAWLERRRGERARYSSIIEKTKRRGVWLLMASRWMFGLRIVIPAACGAVGMRPLVFTLVDFVAVLIWAVALGTVGYRGGAAIEGHLREYRQVGMWGVLAVALALASVFGARRVQRQGRLRELGWSDLHAVVPFVMGLIGLLNIVSGLWPRSVASLASFARWVPLDVRGNRLVMLFAGVALLQVTRSLARRKELAWWVATLALALSLVSHLAPRVEPEQLVGGLLLAYMLIFKRRFTARSDPATLKLAVSTVPVLAIAIVGYGWLGLSALRDQFLWPAGSTPFTEAVRAGILIMRSGTVPQGPHAERFLASVQVAGWLARLYLLVLLLRPVILRARQEAPEEDLARLRRTAATHGLAAFALRPDKHHLLVDGGQALVAFAVRNAVAVACGDPVGPVRGQERSVAEFVRHSRRHGWTPCFYGTAEETRAAYAAAGLRTTPVAEEAVLALRSDTGGAPAAEGTAAGLTVRRYDRGAGVDAVLDQQILEVSDAWLDARDVEELHFTFGALDLDALVGAPVFVVESESRVEAFCAWLPYRDGRAVALDLLRERPDAVAEARATLLAGALEALRAQGKEEASLGLAPRVGADAPGPGSGHGLSTLPARLPRLYTPEDLGRLEGTFPVTRVARSLVYASERDLARIAVALGEVHTKLHETHPLKRLAAGVRALARRASHRENSAPAP
jgi:lysylphosphatidylglycerol synthetase-like protein (DUF2156 family)